MVGDQLTYVDVTGDNYQAVLRAAQANPSWDRLDPNGVAAFKQLTENWGPLEYDVEVFNAMHEALTTEWTQKVEIRDDELPENGKIGPAQLTTVVKAAVAKLIDIVEPEILKLVGLPRLSYTARTAWISARNLAYYEAKTQEIHFKSTGWYSERLLHEFGHHIEEQGPLETWLGMTSYPAYWALLIQAVRPNAARKATSNLKTLQ